MRVCRSFSIFLFSLCLISLALPLFAADTAAGLIASGDALAKKWEYTAAVAEFEKALALEPENYTALWKAADNLVKEAMLVSKDKKEPFFEKAAQYANKAVKANPNGSDGFTMLAVSEGRLALFKGGKQKVTLSKNVKINAEKALKINPNDDRALHVLGAWNREVATLGFILKAFAKIIYGGLPPASEEKAVEFMEKAVSIAPDQVEHYLELGKCYEEVDKEDEARKAYEKCIALPATEKYDGQFKKEAKELLDDL